MMTRLIRLFPLVLALGFFAGCGGGSGSSRGGAFGIYLSDSFRDDYDQIWATIYKVDLIDKSGAARTAFDDPAGQMVNLRTLHDASGARFLMLDFATVQPHVAEKVRLTLAPALKLASVGQTNLQDVPFDDSLPKDSSGNVQVQFPLARARDLTSGNDNLVIDFDLANFQIANGKVVPALKEGDRTLLGDHNHHNRHNITGLVSNLSGTPPNLTFTLDLPHHTLTVKTDANTGIYNADHSANPMLANGQRVTVRGILDAATHTVLASDIRIENAGQHHHGHVIGVPSAIDPAAGTFRVSALHVSGIDPHKTFVNVRTDANTGFLDYSGTQMTAADFFTALASAPLVGVVGVYDAATNTLTAVHAKLMHGNPNSHHHGHHVKAAGTLTNADPAHSRFTIDPLDSWEGFIPNHNRVDVATTANTEFKDSAGHDMTAQNFYDYVTMSAQAGVFKVKVEGTGGADLITAGRVQLTP